MSSRRSHPSSQPLSALALALPLLAGCGLLLDVDPPDRQVGPRRDAGPRDAGARDAGPRDAGARDGGADGGAGDGGIDAGPPRGACTGQGDGVECTPATPGDGRFICLTGACVASRCGDLFVDLEAGEECDDGNGSAGDGCEPEMCRLSCASPTDCDDGVACTTDACDSSVCMYANAEGPCDEIAGEERVCAGGLCVPAGCGNGMVDESEACDDGNDGNGDGCDTDCTFSCIGNADCDDGDPCNGEEICDSSAHTCVRGTAVRCLAVSPCVVAYCDRSGSCVSELVDADGDGHAPLRLGACGTDCDDADATRYAGAPELCDGRDNDCDGAVDEDVVTVACYLDADGDGWGSPEAPVSDCVCPPGRVGIDGDCWDGPGLRAGLVHPGQRAFFAEPYCVSAEDCRYDYDCSGSEEARWPTAGAACRAVLLDACLGDGWVGDVPACGDPGTWKRCVSLLGLGLSCRGENATRIQQCR